jgi:hypothetical protein
MRKLRPKEPTESPKSQNLMAQEMEKLESEPTAQTFQIPVSRIEPILL